MLLILLIIPGCSKFGPIMLEVDSDYSQITLYCQYTDEGLAFVLHF